MSQRKKRQRLRRQREESECHFTMSYYITAQAAIRYYFLALQSGDREVGGYCKFHVDENNNCIITEIRPIKQDSTECYFEIGAKENGLFLESLVADGEDPKDWGMLFHTHPSGMSADMSGVDIRMLTEMAKDLPGQVARSIILPQGELLPLVHEAVQIEGRVFLRESKQIQILDTTGALDDLKKIGFFDVPKVVVKPAQRHSGYTHQYGFGSRELVPLRPAGSSFHGRQFSTNDGWFDETPMGSEIVRDNTHPMDTADYSSWLDDAWVDRASQMDEDDVLDALDAADAADAASWDAAEDFIGETVIYNGHPVTVIDAYVHPSSIAGDEIVLVLPDNKEVTLAEVTMPTTLKAVGETA